MKVVIADDIRGVFNDLQRLAPTVIAGGYLRDMIHGVKFKDVDFIVDGKPDLTGFVGYWSGGYYGDAGCERILDVFKGNTANGTRFDVICVKGNYQDHIDNFDFGINQVWWDGQLHVTKKFVADHLTETLNFTKPEYDIRNTRNRGVRIATKLGFTFRGVKYEKPKEMSNPCREVTREYIFNRGWNFIYDGDDFTDIRPRRIIADDAFIQQALADLRFVADWHEQDMNQVRHTARVEADRQQAVQERIGYRDWMGQQAIDRMNQARQDREEHVRRMAETYRGVWQR